ncbi:DUF6708 domain-containing protein [Cupriavidus plantarum]|uniref:DUF6708 domain-containing protein n=1 Tax=Cupriavidus plantarum TaxID=942865 RepID=UPI00339D466D
MDYTGLVQRYRNNRPLTDDERVHQLHQKQRLEVPPRYELAVIQMNSTFLDSVDRHYESRGNLLLMALLIGGLCIGAFIAFAVIAAGTVTDGVGTASEATTFMVVVGIMLGLVVCMSAWIARKEVGRLTHYPIRLDRRHRMIHLFKPTGGMLSVPWDSVFFTLGRCGGGTSNPHRDIRGLILDTDGRTVRDQFAFSMWSTELKPLQSHWEFLRRYMEDGPRALIGQVEFVLPIASQKESFRVSCERVFAMDRSTPIIYWLMWPWNALTAVARWLVMRSCRIPVWPADIEASTRPEPGDRYVKDAASNPPDLR